jgi:drug/metabolite transporter (DMT)-like permease
VAWQLGALTFFVGTSCNFVALSLTAQAVVSAIGSLQFVSNVVFARALLKEAITVRTITATLLILSADAALVLSSTHADSPHTVTDLASLFQQSPFLIYLASSLSASCVLALLRHRLSPKYSRLRTPSAPPPLVLSLFSSLNAFQPSSAPLSSRATTS